MNNMKRMAPLTEEVRVRVQTSRYGLDARVGVGGDKIGCLNYAYPEGRSGI